VFDRILVCLDGSELSEQIVPYASELASRFGSELVLMQVMEALQTTMAPGGAGPVPVPHDLERFQKEQQRVNEYLEQVAQPLRERGLQVECVNRLGTPKHEIIDYAQQQGVQLIALSSHGRGGLKRMILGSIADAIVRESGLPVLTITPQQDEEQDTAG